MVHWRKIATLDKLLTQAVAGCVGDGRGVTLQLSGGLDSAVVQAIARLPVVYCCTWPEFDNLSLAERVACGAEIRPVTFTRDEMIAVALPEVARITRGRGTWTQCCQWFLARAMARDGYRVVMNGEGSDELFSGYARYRWLYWIDRAFNDPHLVEYQGFAKTLGLDRAQLLERMFARYGSSGPVVAVDGVPMTQLLGAHDGGQPLHELIEFEHDVAAAHGIEHRWPYMHADVVAFARTLDETDKITERESKHILRELARGLGVHPACVDEVTKRGLTVPPSWAPAGEPRWSRAWFEREMAAAYARAPEARAPGGEA
jgi:asparagine synthetase B (glutamine-hydrolysing)